RPSAHATALVRVAPARVERRSARGPGAARSRELVDDADLYAPSLPAFGPHLRSDAPPRPAPLAWPAVLRPSGAPGRAPDLHAGTRVPVKAPPANVRSRTR